MAEILEKKHTYTDYRNLDADDDFIYELINGELAQKNAPARCTNALCENSWLP